MDLNPKFLSVAQGGFDGGPNLKFLTDIKELSERLKCNFKDFLDILFLAKVEILVKGRNFGQKSKF
mgnify:CR=1 FL=1